MASNTVAPTVAEAERALRDHLVQRACWARSLHGPFLDLAALERMLADRRCARYPVQIVMSGERLLPGEPAALLAGDGRFELVLHPRFAERPLDLVLLASYHLPRASYGRAITRVEAELYAAALLDQAVEVVYQRMCELANELESV